MADPARRLTESMLREPLRARLSARPPVREREGRGRAAAVLVPLFERDGEVYVWLLRRPERMRTHSGQVAFPGGKRDANDTSLLVTALREAKEEVGIDPRDVDVLGQLDDYFTITSYTIAPFVGWVDATYVPVPSPDEVARVFAAPLATFLSVPADIMPSGRGVVRLLRALPRFRGWTVDGEFVWGATAAIARGLGAIVREVLAGSLSTD